MLSVALIVFALAAVGGLVLAIQHFRGSHRPLGLALVHGGAGAAGVVLLLLAVLSGAAPGQGKLSLGLFLAAALGGFLMFAFRLRKKALPSAVVLIHGGVAVAAFVILALAVL